MCRLMVIERFSSCGQAVGVMVMVIERDITLGHRARPAWRDSGTETALAAVGERAAFHDASGLPSQNAQMEEERVRTA
eukprot:scaffold5498_cov37-Tisochrysis_lutea.AAC.2